MSKKTVSIVCTYVINEGEDVNALPREVEALFDAKVESEVIVSVSSITKGVEAYDAVLETPDAWEHLIAVASTVAETVKALATSRMVLN